MAVSSITGQNPEAMSVKLYYSGREGQKGHALLNHGDFWPGQIRRNKIGCLAGLICERVGSIGADTRVEAEW
jgi:hypothetical protein